MRFQGYTEVTNRERRKARAFAEQNDVSVYEVLRRMAGYGRLDADRDIER